MFQRLHLFEHWHLIIYIGIAFNTSFPYISFPQWIKETINNLYLPYLRQEKMYISICFLKKKLNKEKTLHRPGIEPGPPAWQASILPLNQRCGYAYGGQNCLIEPHGERIWMERSKLKQKGQKLFAVGRIRTYAPRGNLISSQTP